MLTSSTDLNTNNRFVGGLELDLLGKALVVIISVADLTDTIEAPAIHISLGREGHRVAITTSNLLLTAPTDNIPAEWECFQVPQRE